MKLPNFRNSNKEEMIHNEAFVRFHNFNLIVYKLYKFYIIIYWYFLLCKSKHRLMTIETVAICRGKTLSTLLLTVENVGQQLDFYYYHYFYLSFCRLFFNRTCMKVFYYINCIIINCILY